MIGLLRMYDAPTPDGYAGWKIAPRSTAASAPLARFLNRRARHGAVGTVNTTIAGFRFEHSVALLALVEPLAGIGWHRLVFAMPAIGACQR